MSGNDYTWVRKSEWDRIVRKLDGARCPDGSLKVRNTRDQLTISSHGSAPQTSDAGSPVLCLVAAYNSSTYLFFVTFFANGIESGPTGTGEITMLNAIPSSGFGVGDYIMAFPVTPGGAIGGV